MKFPERINITKVVSYDVPQLISEWKSINGADPTYEDIYELIEEYAREDFSACDCHKANIRDLIIQDENGNELHSDGYDF